MKHAIRLTKGYQLSIPQVKGRDLYLHPLTCSISGSVEALASEYIPICEKHIKLHYHISYKPFLGL